MEFIPIKTRVLVPPQDDLFSVLDEYLTDIRDGDILCISSKVVAIHQGRCVPIGSIEKKELVEQEAELVIGRDYYATPLTIKQSTFIGASGIDESNANGFYVLMPDKLFEFAEMLHTYVCKKYSLSKLGIIITDSRSLPMRFGATGVSLSYWGFKPLIDHRGEKDLFGREIKHEHTNLADGIAAGVNVVMGEVAECTPLVIARNVPQVTYTNSNSPEELFTGFEDDMFRVLYERFLR